MTMVSKNLGVAMASLAPPGYAYGNTHRHFSQITFSPLPRLTGTLPQQ